MINEFLKIVFVSIKLDKNLYKDPKNFGEYSLYFAGIIMILEGIAGAIALSTMYKTNVIMSGATSLISWIVWAGLIYIIGIKLFPDENTDSNFKKIMVTVGFAHSPGLLRFFALSPTFVIPIVFLTQFWIFASLIIATKQILNLKSSFKAFGIVFLSFLIIAFLSTSFVMSRMDALPISTIS